MDRLLWEQSSITTSELIFKINQLSDQECLNTVELSLYQNKVTHIPKEIARFKNLKLLGVQGGLVSSAAKELEELKYLTNLYFASSLLGNPLKIIPTSVYELINLTDLTLSKCSLKYISHSIGKLINLRRLNIDENRLKHLPTELIKLKKLTELTIGSNHLPKILMRKNYHHNAQKLLEKIYKYYTSRENNIRKSIYQFLCIMKYKNILTKDTRTIIAKLLWDSRQEPAWSSFH